MKEITQTTDDKLHELSQTASHEVQETSQPTTEDLRGSGRYTNQTAQETAQETQGLGDATSPGPTRPSSSVPMKDRDAIADVTLKQAEGKRVRYLVLNQAGSILAAPGQIVTLAIIDRVQVDRRERLLLKAVGLM
ncbi:hypothetical protein E1H12_06030 [Geitlerinema sp. P-1104]|uniref:hypothetical protein n=1 Tax=Geitlerinema sp. P-1104 TaxID=2546230 RepID=UPI0016AA07B4|nr:hypothetical protein [Geitlerinema sp. P-1104]NMG58096.1 hypothetical protein [Geitlerinema sp. P-1104]